ncbi:uncharacterized protein LOC130933622 [Arachis stenosperma]|uniref:uncharacterized protein LOC130933622 n=1 Tax=Arachis stenosperma TaxID=217475 RepID=UPI0025AC3A3C|nr:uncharacterized protein LOC130933622 [Arachis stenosperma]
MLAVVAAAPLAGSSASHARVWSLSPSVSCLVSSSPSTRKLCHRFSSASHTGILTKSKLVAIDAGNRGYPLNKICYIYYHLLLDIQTSLSTPVRKPRKLKIYKMDPKQKMKVIACLILHFELMNDLMVKLLIICYVLIILQLKKKKRKWNDSYSRQGWKVRTK